MLCGEAAQRAVGLAVELDEDVVPDLEHVRIVTIHEMGSIAAANPKGIIIMWAPTVTWDTRGT